LKICTWNASSEVLLGRRRPLYLCFPPNCQPWRNARKSSIIVS
jgi:hypothetical protein